MKYAQIRKMQRIHGLDEMQKLIFKGAVWHMEGAMGRAAMDALKCGACMLPKVRKTDYWGNVVPSRFDVKPGSTGSFKNCSRYWDSIMFSKN